MEILLYILSGALIAVVSYLLGSRRGIAQTASLKASLEASQKRVHEIKEDAEKRIQEQNQQNLMAIQAQQQSLLQHMQTTSEDVLRQRREELEHINMRQVQTLVDPLRECMKNMQDALERNKVTQVEALSRLDESIKNSMQQSAQLGESADRLSRALTGNVKVQGNFGELKLKQLFERLELSDGQQYNSQATLRDASGNLIRDDEDKSLIPDFILHFPDNRHVVVDSKMSLTDFERYMNSEDGDPERAVFLKKHVESVRSQVKLLSRKDYSRWLPKGYNKLNFVIMYIPVEQALQLAVLNDTALWNDAYSQGVMILGPNTMYMNLRVLEMVWTQVRQLENQEEMVKNASTIVERVQDFVQRFEAVETAVTNAQKAIAQLKITTAASGPGIITAARNLMKAGASSNRKKKQLPS